MCPGELVGLAPHEHGIDGCPVGGHDLLDVAAEVQPVQRAVRPCEEPVEAHGAAVGDRSHTKYSFRNDTISPFRNGQAVLRRPGIVSPRPRKVSDEELFAATHAMMARVGPGQLTLAAIAREAGVTAAVLVQRFGSK